MRTPHIRLNFSLRRPLVIYDFCNCSILNFLLYEENLIFFFISVKNMKFKLFTLKAFLDFPVGGSCYGSVEGIPRSHGGIPGSVGSVDGVPGRGLVLSAH